MSVLFIDYECSCTHVTLLNLMVLYADGSTEKLIYDECEHPNILCEFLRSVLMVLNGDICSIVSFGCYQDNMKLSRLLKDDHPEIYRVISNINYIDLRSYVNLHFESVTVRDLHEVGPMIDFGTLKYKIEMYYKMYKVFEDSIFNNYRYQTMVHYPFVIGNRVVVVKDTDTMTNCRKNMFLDLRSKVIHGTVTHIDIPRDLISVSVETQLMRRYFLLDFPSPMNATLYDSMTRDKNYIILKVSVYDVLLKSSDLIAV